MQIASRQPMWNEGGRGTVIEVNMTPTTGLYIKFVYTATTNRQITGSRSAAYKRAVNLERFIAPNAQWIGQRDFAYCSKLKEAVLGNVGIHYDGSFQYCTSLEKFTTINTGCCWSYVWQGCTRLRELRLGNVTQFATQDFDQCPNLMDIWIDGKTVEQIKGTAPEGNIAHGYGAVFPWCANASCRFHGTNGIVLGNGTIIHE